MTCFETTHYFNLENPIVQTGFAKDYFFAVDCRNTLYILDTTYTLVSKIQLIKDATQRHAFCNAYSLMHGMLAIPYAKTLMLTHYQNDKLNVQAKHPLYEQNIVFTKFSQDGLFLFSASEDGRSHIVDTQTHSLRYIFANQPDYCSYAVFSQHNLLIFVGYFNNQSILLNLHDDTPQYIDSKNPIECALFFDDDTKLFLTDRAGNSIIYDTITHQELSKKALFTDWVSCAVASPNQKHIILGTRKNKIYLLDPFTNEIAMQVVLENEGISSLNLQGDTLVISFVDATIQVIDTAFKKEEFITHVTHKAYDKAKEMLDTNHFLYLDDAILDFEAGFEDVLFEAKEYMSKGEIEKAIALTTPFMDKKEFARRVDLLFMQQDHIAKFIEATQENRLEDAYALAHKYQLIQSLSLYELLEKKWEKAFSLARNILEEDLLKGKLRAKEILARYEKIPQKSELVKQLINNVEKFALAEKLIKSQDFTNYFALIGNYPFLQGTLLCKKVESLAANIQSSALEAFSKKRYTEAKKYFSQLLKFPSFASNARKHINKINAIFLLERAIEEKDFYTAYELQGKFPFLAFVDIFLEFNVAFEQTIQKALVLTQTNKIPEAIVLLQKYIPIQTLSKKIDNCMRLGYLKEIEHATLDEAKMQRAIGRYKTLFGLDEDIATLFYKKGLVEEFKTLAKSKNAIATKKYPPSIFV